VDRSAGAGSCPNESSRKRAKRASSGGRSKAKKATASKRSRRTKRVRRYLLADDCEDRGSPDHHCVVPPSAGGSPHAARSRSSE
jgi:hypothetical protein